MINIKLGTKLRDKHGNEFEVWGVAHIFEGDRIYLDGTSYWIHPTQIGSEFFIKEEGKANADAENYIDLLKKYESLGAKDILFASDEEYPIVCTEQEFGYTPYAKLYFNAALENSLFDEFAEEDADPEDEDEDVYVPINEVIEFIENMNR